MTLDVVGLAAAVAIVGSNALALSPIAPAVGGQLGVSGPSVMAAASGYGLGAAASAAFGGAMIDRLGPERAWRGALLALSAAMLASAAAPTLWALIAAQSAAGLAAGMALPSAYARVSEVAPVGRESETLGVVLTGWTVSMVLGVAFAALVADWIGWRSVYGAFGALALSLVWSSAFFSPPANGRRSEGAAGAEALTAPRRSPASNLVVILAAPGVAATLLACAAYMHAFYGVYGYLGDHLVSSGLSVGSAGLAAVSYGLGFGAAAFADAAIDRLGVSRALVLSLLGVAVAYLALAGAAMLGPWPLIALCAPWGFLNHLGLNTLIGRLSALQPTRRGQTLGLYTAATYLSLFSGTLLFQPVYVAQGFSTAALLGAAMLAGGLAMAFLSRRAVPEQGASASG